MCIVNPVTRSFLVVLCKSMFPFNSSGFCTPSLGLHTHFYSVFTSHDYLFHASQVFSLKERHSMCMCACVCMQVHMHTRAHTRTHTRARAHTHTHTHTHALTLHGAELLLKKYNSNVELLKTQ